MKTLIYLIIAIIISLTLTSAIQKTNENTKTITLQSTIKNPGSPLLKHSAEIISSRLNLYGLKSFEINVSAEKDQLILVIPEKTDISRLEGLLTTKGNLAFYETYTHEEMTGLLGKDNRLFTILNHNQEISPEDPRAGCISIESRNLVDDYLRSATPIRNCKLVWGLKSAKSEFCLFALKTNPDGSSLLVRSDVASVKIDSVNGPETPTIKIKLKLEATSRFAEATRKNMNKSIAIVIDDYVYSWPRVRSVIEGGEVEISGNFTNKEVNYFPVIFNTEQLPVIFKLLK